MSQLNLAKVQARNSPIRRAQHRHDREKGNLGGLHRGKGHHYRPKGIDNYEQATRPAVPHLKLCPYPYGDVPGWTRHLLPYATKEFGDVGAALTRDRYYDTYQAPLLTEELDIDNDPDGVKTIMHTERVKRQVAEEIKCEEMKLKCFMFVIGQLSIESEEVVKSHQDYIDNENTIRKDPILLIKIIGKTHAPALVAPSAPVAIRQSLEELSQMRQREVESLEAYKIRYEGKVSELRLLQGPQFILSPELQVHQFLSGIDRRKHDAFIKWIDRGAIEDRDYPTTISKVLELARHWKWTETGPPKGHVAVAYGLEEVRGNRHANKSEKNGAKQQQQKGKAEQKQFTCMLCMQPGHGVTKCPRLADAQKAVNPSEKAAKSINMTRTANRFSFDDSEDDEDVQCAYVTFVHADLTASVNRVGKAKYSYCSVILDNCAEVSIFSNSKLLINVRETDVPLRYEGVVKGYVRETKLCGDYHGVTVYVDELMPFNLLCMNDIEMLNRGIEYHPAPSGNKGSFTWTTVDDFDIVFLPSGAFVACDHDNPVCVRRLPSSVNASTVEERAAAHSKKEIQLADVARDLERKLCFPSKEALYRLSTSRDLGVSVADIRLAYDIYGKPVEQVQGKAQQRVAKVTPSQRIVDMFAPVRCELHIDLFFLYGLCFLLSVSVPHHATLTARLDVQPRGVSSLLDALNKMVGVYNRYNIVISRVVSDREGALAAMYVDAETPGIEFEFRTHSGPAENAIKVVKQNSRAIVKSVRFDLPKFFVQFAVVYATKVMNMLPSKAGVEGMLPLEALTGRYVNFKTHLPLGFCDYVQVKKKAPPGQLENKLESRTYGALALYPVGNDEGAVRFFNLHTGRLTTSSVYTQLPLPMEVQSLMNMVASRFPMVSEDESKSASDSRIVEGNDGEYNLPAVEKVWYELLFERSRAEAARVVPAHIKEPAEPTTQPDEVVKPEQPSVETSEPPQLDVGVTESIEQPVEPVSDPPRYDFRERKPRAFVLHSEIVIDADAAVCSTMTVKQAMTKHPEAAVSALRSELSQFLDKQVFTPVFLNSLSPDQRKRVITSLVFLKEKFLPDGTFEKLKARIVAGGHQQDRSEYDPTEISSPTASMIVIFMLVCIWAWERRKTVAFDVPAAYLNAPLAQKDGRRVLVRIPKVLAEELVTQRPEWEKYRLDNGDVIVEVNRAWYGLIQSGRLWYDEANKSLTELGYVANPLELCVYNKRHPVTGVQCTVILYVDDMLVSSKDESMIDEVRQMLKTRYGGTGERNGDRIPFLGMMFDFSVDGEVRVSQPKFIDDYLAKYPKTKPSRYPAPQNLFEVDPESEPLSATETAEFHSEVATLLYLAHRTRGDIMLAVSFLTTRVLCPTAQDLNKLLRVRNYVAHTAHLYLRLKTNDGKAKMHIDASYGVHPDMKSHSGMVVTLGAGAVECQSMKQKTVVKSSCHAELTAVTDKVGWCTFLSEFFEFQGEGYEHVVIFYQDNESTIKLIKNGPGSVGHGSRHISIREFWFVDYIKAGFVAVEYMPTRSMRADILTKPLTGELFLHQRALLLGHHD